MALWRTQALNRFSRLKQCIESSETVMSFWGELWFEFEKAYRCKPIDEAMIMAVYRFADWCVNAPRNDDASRDPLSSTVVCFFEHILYFKPSRDDMPRWFSYSDVKQSKQVFSYMIGEAEYELLVEYMEQNQKKYRPR